MAPLTIEIITQAVFSTSPLKSPSPDAIPALVWKKAWPAIKDVVVWLLTSSIELGVMLDQWKLAEIIPLRKSQKEDYTLLGAYRPISLLATLGKILESFIAQRISFMVKEYLLFPYNYFGGLR